MPFPLSEFASATISKWQVIIIEVTQAHRVTSKLLFPLLRTAGDKKSLSESNLCRLLQANKKVHWHKAEQLALSLRTENAPRGDCMSKSFTADLGTAEA